MQLYSLLQLIYSPLKLIYLAALLSSAVDLLSLAVGLPRSSTPLGSRPALLAQLQDAPVQF